MNDYFKQPDLLDYERPRQEESQECPHLTNGKRCGKPVRDRSQSRLASSAKCEDHARMVKLGIRI